MTIANLSLETSDMNDSLSWTDSAVRVIGGSGNDTGGSWQLVMGLFGMASGGVLDSG